MEIKRSKEELGKMLNRNLHLHPKGKELGGVQTSKALSDFLHQMREHNAGVIHRSIHMVRSFAKRARSHFR